MIRKPVRPFLAAPRRHHEPYIDPNPTGLIRCSNADIDEAVPGLHDHSDIDALEVGEVAPPDDAPILVLLAYVIRTRWASGSGLLVRLWRRRPWGWVTVRDTGFTMYQQHPSGRRRVVQASAGYQPIDRRWVETGEWSEGPRASARERRRALLEVRATAAASTPHGPPPPPAPGRRGR